MEYYNPILKGDYSDPDVIRVGNDYYMVSSSFTYFPSIPLLHSKDLVHWRQINHVAQSLPFTQYDRPMHKRGLWAPSLRYHNGLFYVYACTPDEGLFAFTAKDPQGAWTLHHVKDVVGWIDPCPFWDGDGNAYLVHAFAGSRVGINGILYLHRMSDDGLQIIDNGRMVFDGGSEHTTLEGPKLYKHDGMYYILAPAGGVTTGWQLAMRSESIWGPYTAKRVLAQGDTPINGPHQGGLVDTPSGESWFIHFQDAGAYGRILHLQPVWWQDGWPMMGQDGVPVLKHAMPDTGSADDGCIQTSDDFIGEAPGLQWQWQANPNPAWFSMLRPGLRLFAAQAPSLFEAGQYLSQLMQSFNFTWTVKVTPHFTDADDRAGIAMMGYSYAYLAVTRKGLTLVRGEAVQRSLRENELVTETESVSLPMDCESIWLRMEIQSGTAVFYASTDGKDYQKLGDPFTMDCGGWTSARPGIFCMNTKTASSIGFADFSYVQII